MPRKKVASNLDLERDESTTAVINTNRNEFTSYLKQKQLRDAMVTRISNHDEDIDTIRKDLKALKTNVNKILKLLSGGKGDE